MNTRIFVEKKLRFQNEAKDMLNDIRSNLLINLDALRVVNTYDVFDVNEEVLEIAKNTVFAEPMVDNLLEQLPECDYLIGKEFLPGQYDQRADSATQCIKLLNPSSQATIRSGQAILLYGQLSEQEIKTIKNYLINPVEAREKDFSSLEIDVNVDVLAMEDLTGFIQLSEEEINEFVKSHGMAMTALDLAFVQKYFRDEEKRDPKETELKVLDTYWSDHCRHTTFETCLNQVVIHHDRFQKDIEDTFNLYLQLRKEAGRENKPITLMDMGTINARYLKSIGLHTDVERSEEINACSVFVDVDVNGTMEKWLMQFKNETHNHPTEIEPFGGASTCIGGAIRDPLSGRSYVYQAMRIAGCGDITQPVAETLASKLPQRLLSKKATAGNSSYGNQIGLPTTYAREIYHPNYVAKHLELGAVVGAVKASDVRRETLTKGDIIILLGGDTGRDGIGGATGSSKEHNDSSLKTCAAEVQKGNAVEERKIQRLFRNPEVTKLIKKCNDFGAGGVCVAIGELADGLNINLDRVELKYSGLNPTEIAISESQERMAVGVEAKDVERFIEMATKENLKAYVVAEVTDKNRLVMSYKGETVVDLSRDFINTSGVRGNVNVEIVDAGNKEVLADKEVSEQSILSMLSSLNCACQKGISEIFDASIGSTTVLMPWAGKRQLTPTQASIQKFPVLNGKTNTCSILAYGFSPELMADSPYRGAQASILSSMSKTIAAGGKLDNIHFSFQEYFERLHDTPTRWGVVAQALLGAIKVQHFFNKGAIGGKDSMSGTFKDLDVPPTFVSFACSAADARNIISPEAKNAGNKLVLYKPVLKDGLFDLASYESIYRSLEKEIEKGNVISSYVLEDGGLTEAAFKMVVGSDLGFKLFDKREALNVLPGAILVECNKTISNSYASQVGLVIEKGYVVGDIVVDEKQALNAWMKTIGDIYPIYGQFEAQQLENVDCQADIVYKSTNLSETVKVCIPVFPGNNCEYDVKRAFEDEGAVGEIVVFENHNEQQINDSIERLAASIRESQIFAIPGGFSSGDEPDGSAKFIVNVLKNEKIKASIEDLLARDGLILGICNGFQALIKSGLLPYGRIMDLTENDATLYRNTVNRHVSTMAHTRVASTKSPWLQSFNCGDDHMIAMSHGEGRFVCSEEMLKTLIENGQIAFQYCDDENQPTMDSRYNINNSDYAIEGIISPDGHILGKMGHSERYQDGLFIDIYGNKKQNIFKNGVDYFKK